MAFESLTKYAVAARYDDPAWAASLATRANSGEWLERSRRLLSLLLP